MGSIAFLETLFTQCNQLNSAPDTVFVAAPITLVQSGQQRGDKLDSLTYNIRQPNSYGTQQISR